jgi:TatD DNase family protein
VRLIDTHCHLADGAYATDLGEVVSRAAAAGVGHTVVIGETPEQAAAALGLVERWPGLSATAGLHPHEASRWSGDTAEWLRRALRDDRVVAAGEMGLDYHYNHSPRDAQRVAFEAQLDLAAEAGKPAVIHARDADEDIAAILANHAGVVAVMHSFSGSAALLGRCVALGAYLSFSGMITFKSWRLDPAIASVPIERFLIETDGPYLAPVPYRGRRNEPAYLTATARRLGEVVGRTVEEIGSVTTANAIRVFGNRLTETTGSGA